MSENEVARKDDVNEPEHDAKPDDGTLGIEIGVEQNLPFAMPFYDPSSKNRSANQQLIELLRETGEDAGPTVQQLVTMRQMDGQARALYRLITLPIRAALAKSTFVAAEGGEKEAEFITNVFTLPPQQGGMSVTFHRFMSQLLSGLFDGFSAFEQVYWRPTYGPLKGKYALKKLAYRPSETITFVTDKKGSFNGFRQRAYVSGETVDVHIERENAFYYAAQEEERKFYGVSFFQSAFYHYDKKIKMYYIAHLAAQRAAVGTRVGTLPVNAGRLAKAEFATNLSNLALAQWMMIPEGFKVEMLKEGGTFPFLDYINHHNSQMSKSILAGFFDENQGAGSNDSAIVSFGQPGDDMFMLMLQSIMGDIANSINHYIIPRLIDWNFEGAKYPTFQWAALTEEQKGSISKTFDKLATAGQTMNVTPEFMRELEKFMASEMGLEIDFDEIEKMEKEEKEILAQQQAELTAATAGVPLASPEDQAISDFEAAAGGAPTTTPAPAGKPNAPGHGLNAPTKPQQKVKLTADYELIKMAHDLLDSASETIDLSRRVKTTAGVKKFKSPLGSVITDDPNEAAGGAEGGERPVTIERLMSLQSMLDSATKTSNKAAMKDANDALLQAVSKYSAGRDPKYMNALLKKLAGHTSKSTK